MSVEEINQDQPVSADSNRESLLGQKDAPKLPPEIQADLEREFAKIETEHERELAAIKEKHRKYKQDLLDMERGFTKMELESAIVFSKEIKSTDQKIASKLAELELSQDEVELSIDSDRYQTSLSILEGKIRGRGFRIEYSDSMGLDRHFVYKATSDSVKLTDGAAEKIINTYLPLAQLYDHRRVLVDRIEYDLDYTEKIRGINEKQKNLADQDILEDLLPKEELVS